jgi:hypothetical protein
VASLVLFFRGYRSYFEQSTSDLLGSTTLEPPADLFALPWLLGLLVLALILFFASFAGLRGKDRSPSAM